MRPKHPKQYRTASQTGVNVALVGKEYERLDVAGTKKAFVELNANLEKLDATVIHTLDQALPYLEKMQALLSQRGTDRKRVLRKAGLPRWTPWAKTYAAKLDRSMRTVQNRIKRFRQPQEHDAGEPAGKTKVGGSRNRLRLNARQQSALVKAQMAANDLASALRNGADWQAPLAKYEKIAVTPSTLDEFVNALSPEPDWKLILADFSATLGQCAELPAEATNALHKVQRLLSEQATSYPSPSVSKATANLSEFEAAKSPEEADDFQTIQEPELAVADSPTSQPSVAAAPPAGQGTDEDMIGEAPSAESSPSSEQAPQPSVTEKDLRRKLQKAEAAKRYKLKKKAEKEARTHQASAKRSHEIETQVLPGLESRQLTNGVEPTVACSLLPSSQAVSIGLGL